MYGPGKLEWELGGWSALRGTEAGNSVIPSSGIHRWEGWEQ